VLVQRTEQIDVAFGDLLPFFLVGMDVDRLVALNDDAFELLGAEDGTDTAAGVLTELIRTDIGTRFSPAGPITAMEAIGEVWSASICCARRVPWPQILSVAQFEIVVIDVEVDRFFGFAFDDDEVIAGLVQASGHSRRECRAEAIIGTSGYGLVRINGCNRSTAGTQKSTPVIPG